jgi:hypothetical protein
MKTIINYAAVSFREKFAQLHTEDRNTILGMAFQLATGDAPEISAEDALIIVNTVHGTVLTYNIPQVAIPDYLADEVAEYLSDYDGGKRPLAEEDQQTVDRLACLTPSQAFSLLTSSLLYAVAVKNRTTEQPRVRLGEFFNIT